MATFGYHRNALKGLRSMYSSPRMADIHFVCQSPEGMVRIPAHRVIIFAESLSKKFASRGSTPTSMKSLQTTSKNSSSFFYLPDVHIPHAAIGAIANLGYRYNIESCLEACEEFFENHLCTANVCTALSFALMRQDDELLRQCEHRIIRKTLRVLRSDDFLKSNWASMAHIIEMSLPCTEYERFDCAMKWLQNYIAPNPVDIAAVLKHIGRELYSQFGFVSMTPNELCELERKYKLVLQQDYSDLMAMVLGQKKSEFFIDTPRKFKFNKDKALTTACECFANGCSTGENIAHRITSSFSSAVSLILGAIEFCGFASRYIEPDIEVSLTIMKTMMFRNSMHSTAITKLAVLLMDLINE